MKILELNAYEGLDAIADIIPPICEIAMDERTSKLFERETVKEGDSVVKALARRVKDSLPVLIKEHKEALVTILAVLDQKTVEEYLEGKNIAGIIKDIFEFINDPQLETLF